MDFSLQQNPYRLVALDIGNTLIRQYMPGMKAALGFPEEPGDPGLGIEPFGPSFGALLLGKCTQEEYLEEFYERFQGRWSKEEILNAHEKYLLPSIAGMPELIRAMAESGTHFVFFSDINTIHFERFRNLTKGEYDFITDAIRSDEVHALKPSAEMFQAFEDRFGKPDLYLDDRLDLIAVAKERGWNAVQAGDAKGLFQALF